VFASPARPISSYPPSTSSTQAGTTCVAGPYRRSSKARALSEGSRFSSQVRIPSRRAWSREAGGGIDRARGADGHEQVDSSRSVVDRVQEQRRLAEPDHVRPGGPDRAAGRAGGIGAERFGVRPGRVAGMAARDPKFAVHVDHVDAAGLLVQVVDVLGAQEQASALAPPGPSAIGPGRGAPHWASRPPDWPGERCRRPEPWPDRGRSPRAWPPPTGRTGSRSRWRRGTCPGRSRPRSRRRSGRRRSGPWCSFSRRGGRSCEPDAVVTFNLTAPAL
jgi:hypothetical protein